MNLIILMLLFLFLFLINKIADLFWEREQVRKHLGAENYNWIINERDQQWKKK